MECNVPASSTMNPVSAPFGGHGRQAERGAVGQQQVLELRDARVPRTHHAEFAPLAADTALLCTAT
jgi:hypothetical protein